MVAYTEIEETFHAVPVPPSKQPNYFEIDGIHFILIYMFVLFVMALQ